MRVTQHWRQHRPCAGLIRLPDGPLALLLGTVPLLLAASAMVLVVCCPLLVVPQYVISREWTDGMTVSAAPNIGHVR